MVHWERFLLKTLSFRFSLINLITFFIFFFASIVASVFTGVFIIAASFAECDKVLVVAYFTVSVAFQGVPGIAINSLDLSPNYAGILMGIGGAVTSITGILVPYMVGVATPNVSTHRSYSFLLSTNVCVFLTISIFAHFTWFNTCLNVNLINRFVIF